MSPRNTVLPLFLLLAGIAALSQPAWADSRAERPLQVQFDTGGITLGYHVSERIYVGVTQQPRILAGYSYGRRHDDSERELYDQKGIDSVDLEYAQRTSVEVRWSPWPFGLYFAAGALATGADRQKVDYDGSPRVVGDGAYPKDTTDLRIDVKDKPQTALAGGVGFNHVFKSGFSLGAGILLALRESDTPEVKVTDRLGAIAQADLNKLKKKVEDDNRGPQGMLHLAIGWNF